MGRIVLGIGTSHSPLLTFDAELWLERACDDLKNEALTLSDGRTLSYAALLAERGPIHADKAAKEKLTQQAARTQVALYRLEAALAEVAPDVVLIVGDDQDELYSPGNTPALAIYYGAKVVMRPLGEILASPPAWLGKALGGYAMETAHRFAGSPAFGEKLVEGLMDAGIDVGVASKVDDPKVAAFGHAYGFIARRLLRDGATPIVPILLNTYYPPNVIRPRRCYAIGAAIAEVVEAMPDDIRVAVVASGGLSHFVTDEALDHAVLDAMRRKDAVTLGNVPMAALRAGSSEILCWIMAAGIFRALDHAWSDYVPIYRTAAGTGIGLAFGIWR